MKENYFFHFTQLTNNFSVSWNYDIQSANFSSKEVLVFRKIHYYPDFIKMKFFTVWKVSKYGVFSSSNTGKYGSEKTPYLDTFDAVVKEEKPGPCFAWIHIKNTFWERHCCHKIIYSNQVGWNKDKNFVKGKNIGKFQLS